MHRIVLLIIAIQDDKISPFRIDDSAVYDEDEDSNTALHLACTNRRAKVAEVLLKNGADVQNRNLMKWTPLDCAAAVGAYNCAKLLLDVSKFRSAYHIKCVLFPRD